jgi:hypothetical protein
MFYCDDCGKKRGWPIELPMSYGPCEICHKVGSCNDVPSGALPVPKQRKIPKQNSIYLRAGEGREISRTANGRLKYIHHSLSDKTKITNLQRFNLECPCCGETRLEVEEENAEAAKQYLERREKEKKLEEEQLKKNQERLPRRSFWHR